MTKSFLKQIIKEEIQKVLNESISLEDFQNIKPGDKFPIYGEVESNTGSIIRFKKLNKNFNFNMLKDVLKMPEKFQNPISTPIHEGDKDIYLRGIKNIIGKYGDKAQSFINSKLDGRELNSLDADEIMDLNIELQDLVSTSVNKTNNSIDPNILGKRKGYLGATYTGD
jgi:hypothetical protein